jgi:hypothetical protein
VVYEYLLWVYEPSKVPVCSFNLRLRLIIIRFWIRHVQQARELSLEVLLDGMQVELFGLAALLVHVLSHLVEVLVVVLPHVSKDGLV